VAEKQENSPLLTQAKKAVETALLLRAVLKNGPVFRRENATNPL
jgi:hypothetical protein